ncbi:MAG: hypothetical protein QOI95_2244 [Acidimicrobiaceae bacterium]|jgi:hypothetical protein
MKLHRCAVGRIPLVAALALSPILLSLSDAAAQAATPVVRIASATPAALIFGCGGEPKTVNGVVTVERDGELSQPLVVSYTVEGQVQPSGDGEVTIQAGEATASVELRPLTDNGPPNYVFTIMAESIYELGEPSTAEVQGGLAVPDCVARPTQTADTLARTGALGSTEGLSAFAAVLISLGAAVTVMASRRRSRSR